MKRFLASTEIAITTALSMTNKEAVEIIMIYEPTDLNGDECLASECAINMCLIDVATYGIDHWVSFSPVLVVNIFRATALEVLDEIMDEVESRSAGEDIIDEMLGTTQTERIDYKKALIGMKEGSIRYFDALSLYMEIHEEVKEKYYLVE